jgi:L,D-transpeptidase YcbB
LQFKPGMIANALLFRPFRIDRAPVALLAFALPLLVFAGCGAPDDDPETAVRFQSSFKEDAAETRLVPLPPSRRGEVDEVAARVYEQAGWRPLWLDGRGLSSEAEHLLEALRRSGEEGLDPADYDLETLERAAEDTFGGLLSRPGRDESWALDRALTRAYLAYAHDLALGRVKPEDLDAEWHMEAREIDPAARLARALEAGNLEEALASLPPPHRGYQALREELARYRGLAEQGGWPRVPEGPALSLSELDRQPTPEETRRLRALEARLAAEGYLPEPGEGGELDLERLVGALDRFQVRHGIAVDHILGPETVEELNVPAERRARQIVLNMERWRWLPAELGERRVEVNVPEFMLRSFEGDRPAQTMRVVVGKEGWGTAMFTDEMDHVVVNPEWNVPESIAREEVLPAVRQDPGYLQRNDFEVLSGWDADAEPVNPRSLDWSSVDEKQVRFRQRPGPDNPLGRIKFMFPNQFNIYLHDTSATHLFEEYDRAFSHGCIRVQKPAELASWVFQGDDGEVRQALATSEQQSLPLPEPIPVWIVYWTAYVPPEGGIGFYQDIYGIDAAMEKALRRQD